jgi:hypothetical protein
MRPSRKPGWNTSVNRGVPSRGVSFWVVSIAVLILLACPRLFAQDPQSGSDTDVDNLFNGSEDGSTTQSGKPPESGTPSATVRADDITRDTKLHFFGSADIYGDIGGGWSPLPDFSQPLNSLGYEAAASFQASLGFEVRPVPELGCAAP